MTVATKITAASETLKSPCASLSISVTGHSKTSVSNCIQGIRYTMFACISGPEQYQDCQSIDGIQTLEKFVICRWAVPDCVQDQ